MQNIIEFNIDSIYLSRSYLAIDFGSTIVLAWSGLSNLSSCLIFDMWLSKLLYTPIFKVIELNFAVMYVGCVNYFTNIFSPFLVVNNLEFTSPDVYDFYFCTIVVINKELTPRCVIVVII